MKKKLKHLTLTKAVISKLTFENQIFGGRDKDSNSGFVMCATNCPCTNGPTCQ